MTFCNTFYCCRFCLKLILLPNVFLLNLGFYIKKNVFRVFRIQDAKTSLLRDQSQNSSNILDEKSNNKSNESKLQSNESKPQSNGSSNMHISPKISQTVLNNFENRQQTPFNINKVREIGAYTDYRGVKSSVIKNKDTFQPDQIFFFSVSL